MSNIKPKDVAGRTQAPGNTASERLEPAQVAEPISHHSKALYDQDEFGWLLEQAGLLRAEQFDKIDHHTLAEFLTDIALTQRHAFRSAMAVLLQHMLKVLMQPEKLTRRWHSTIGVQQDHARVIVRDNPGMRRYLPDIYADAYSAARRFASDDTGIEVTRFPVDNPWTMDEALAFRPPAPPSRGRKVMRKS